MPINKNTKFSRIGKPLFPRSAKRPRLAVYSFSHLYLTNMINIVK